MTVESSTPARWIAVHFTYQTMADRLRLIAEQAPALLAEGRGPHGWFFADVPLEAGDGLVHGIEIAVEIQPGDQSCARSELWLQRFKRPYLSSSGGPVLSPVTLDPRLFPYGIPKKYPEALAITGARAVILLRELAKAGEERASASMVAAEVAAIYRSVLPNPADRRRVLQRHARWLENVQGNPERTGLCEHTTSVQVANREEWDLEPGQVRTEYHLLAQMLQLPACVGVSSRGDALDARASAIARLTHTQVVRLWGPERHGALECEESLVRSLCSAVGKDSVS